MPSNLLNKNERPPRNVADLRRIIAEAEEATHGDQLDGTLPEAPADNDAEKAEAK